MSEYDGHVLTAPDGTVHPIPAAHLRRTCRFGPDTPLAARRAMVAFVVALFNRALADGELVARDVVIGDLVFSDPSTFAGRPFRGFSLN